VGADTYGDGIKLAAGGAVTNGSASDAVAYIRGGFLGVGVFDGGTVTNFGSIDGRLASIGIAGTNGGGTVINSGTLRGTGGVYSYGGLVSVSNAGEVIGIEASILSSATMFDVSNTGTIIGRLKGGVYGTSGGTVVNGSLLATNATINGGAYGVKLVSTTPIVPLYGLVENYGTIRGVVGVSFLDSTIVKSSPGTVINAGTIIGTGGIAVEAGYPGRGSVVVDPGAVFVGLVEGGDGTLELAKGASTGTITGLGSSFQSFGTVAIDDGATWMATGSNPLALSTQLDLGAAATLKVTVPSANSTH
jgi:hypothetical protein